MKRWTTVVRALVLAGVVSMTVGTAASQDSADDRRALRARLEDRYQIVTIEDGLALVPKKRTNDVRLVEVSKGVITVNGTVVTGQELRERVGSDADLIVRLSYMPVDQRRELFGGRGATAVPSRSDRRASQETASDPVRARESHGSRVRIFGDVFVNEDESIRDQAVAVIGSVRIDGEVGQEVVAVLGSVDLGPKAVVRGDVVSVGGRVRRAPGAQVRGGVTEVSLGDAGAHVGVGPWFGPFDMPFRGPAFEGFPRLLGSTFRMMVLALFAGIALVVARGSVERSAERVVDNPPKALLVGLAAELLVVPVFVLTAVVFVITLIGIPLLLLLPFAVIMLLLFALVGFTGTAYAIGQAAGRRFGIGGRAAFFDICLGLVVLLSPLLLGRLVGLVGWPANPFAWLLVLTGTAFEFVAWTTGFGAVLINTFSRWRARRVARTAAPVVSS
jgi:hypothetical protein